MNFEEKSQTFGKEETTAEVKRCIKCLKPSCQANGCPAHLRIAEFIKATEEGKTAEAYRIIRRDSNLPLICSRVCDYDSQCRKGCILNARHEPITPGYIERYIAEKEAGKNENFPDISSPMKIAIIGSGPAGLSGALEFIQHGIAVTVFEKENHIGGLLSYGIPEYRLPIAVLHKQIEIIKQAGVKFIMNWNENLDDLEKFDYVIYATGLTDYTKLNIPGEDLEGVIGAGAFLKECNYKLKYHEGEGIILGKVTVVVGAGNAAMDCARIAQRLGSKTIVVYRRSENEAPAANSELQAAKAEGVEFLFLAAPVELIGQDGVLRELKVEKMILGEPDESGRSRPLPTGEYNYIRVDNLIEAIGQKPNTNLADRMKLPLNKGLVQTDENYFVHKNISAAGDIVRGPGTVVHAMLDGKTAALKIIENLKSKR